MGKFVTLLVLCVGLAGCATTGSTPINPCAGWSQMTPTCNDVAVVSDRLSRELLAHNRQGERICGWKRTKGGC